ncbi:protein arginine N-methyltransferase [Abortiporus biennis]|nr:protein arginine N-methyltransferase [Abortiporus biennis]
MSLRLSSHFIEEAEGHHEERDKESSSSSEDEADLTWEDWVSDSLTKRPIKSLFDETTLNSVEEIVAYDKKTHGFDLDEVSTRLALDPYQRIRLINWIRKEKPSPTEANAVQGNEDFFKSDKYLIPVVEDDPLLQASTNDWSDEEDEGINTNQNPIDLTTANRRIKNFEEKLEQARKDMKDYRDFVSKRLNLAGLAEALHEPSSSTHIATPLRDDDSHYFQSYGENDIHAVMIQDKVRTATYAAYIMRNPEVFRDAVVLDVGCGTGILSLFAARAGAKRVFAVDASDIAEKAEKIVKANGFENVITVIRGKIEDISLPDDVKHVDIIVSEWMGYALLYESMLDSVLRARDRFLKPQGGIMAPSQCQMMFALCEAGEIFKERVGFWSDIYGFDLSAMATEVFEDAIVDVVGPETLASEPVVVKDLHIKDITTSQLSFSTPFKLIGTTDRRTKVRAFVLYFDTFFTVNGGPVPEGTNVHIAKEGDPILAEVWQVGGKPHISRRMSSGDPLKTKQHPNPEKEKPEPKVTSFSTGPKSVPTHWKQTLFLLREPITVHEGTVVQGTFKCKKSEGNSRELDVEIHYSVKDESDTAVSDIIVQLYKVR